MKKPHKVVKYFMRFFLFLNYCLEITPPRKLALANQVGSGGSL